MAVTTTENRARQGGLANGMRRWMRAVKLWIAAHPRATRWLLAGPGALVVAVLVIAAMPLWVPQGQAGVNNIVYPLILSPLIWAVAFVYAVIENNLVRGCCILAGLVLVHGFVVAAALAGAW